MAICFAAFYYFDWKTSSNIWIVAIFNIEMFDYIVNIWTQIIIHLLKPSKIFQQFISIAILFKNGFSTIHKISDQLEIGIFVASFFDYKLDLEVSTDLFVVYVLIGIKIVIILLILCAFENIEVNDICRIRDFEFNHRH